jgi:deoxyribose-phosphate aldolase
MELTELAIKIESTLLKADATKDDILQLCDEALALQLLGVCIPPYFIRQAVKRLDGKAKVVSVVGFPLGISNVAAKVEEIKRAVDEGVDEIDAVLNFSAVLANDWHFVDNEIESISRACGMRGKKVKLILEPQLLTPEALTHVLERCVISDVAYVKTNTGMLGHNADPKIVAQLRSALPTNIKIKASAGIQTRKQAEALVEAGATRIGSSNAAKILI